ncbi:MAG TPA: PLP-dependent transferase [Candidatus Eremiobacteraceae bacterium]|nr:PLP-dependent transferase [Candidatus Eremiobacteraceae bacterium]
MPLIVDNTFASPYLCRPIEFGADIVIHSATKFIGGHGTVMAGVVVESGKFVWTAEKHPLVAAASPGYHGMNFAETFGEYAFLMRARAEVLRDFGPCMSPFDAFLLVLGLETLSVRVDRLVSNAKAVARFLEGHEGITWVRYPGTTSDEQKKRAAKYLPRGAGSVFTIGLRGGRPAAVAFIESLRLWSHLANVGDAKSLVIHPASTTHAQLSDDELVRAGVTPEMVRLSVGLEDVDDLIWDLDRALAAAAKAGESAAAAR